jgi:hypothetical protein
MFVHSLRWRKLEGSDPSTYEMIQKIQTLQKRLISKTEEAVEKDLLIQVSQKAMHAIRGCQMCTHAPLAVGVLTGHHQADACACIVAGATEASCAMP